ncbi:MAG: hypothetical protein COW00_03485 [Bdellovibrio sp. CG12_big_fil_rev_8_21_14_0_65_39_13]|nr:MAG: hypothetical protein COW78_10890 [Bdellovibrio sp. CG22_combo_CG10-13_8_21_14_all_39_27]PIQ61639.1 MAG: hypothetical protein COW00_03485 [Bdellovibrio sp. CG12_big_fil_rev_8_21_14_0_65_39_13]PIR35702.1 MAG: hypothetical protein COV37_07280 [Bdellovibrio sp. CG11_big_fil_rev_8_21_14_0_20_39_38]PJB52960.1 MAG: hypothetical protein CO099_09750 [Bdellovibrio sp. CG_4_9_14_3_um_filter_39_7]
MKKINSVVTLALFASSCASTYRPSETIEAKMARFESSKSMVNVVPDLPVKEVKISNRKPASAEADQVVDELAKKPNKRLYFSTLYTQYETMRKIPQNESAPTIQYCPHFHTSVVEYKESNPQGPAFNKVDWKQRYKGDWTVLAESYPELNLPLDDYNQHPKVSEVMSNSETSKMYSDSINEVMNKAFSLHVMKTYRELTELCEVGTSDNYYAYENLLGHIERHEQSRDPVLNNIKTLFKTTLFSNMAIINSLGRSQKKITARGPASAQKSVEDSYQQAVLKRFGVEWFDEYFKTQK